MEPTKTLEERADDFINHGPLAFMLKIEYIMEWQHCSAEKAAMVRDEVRSQFMKQTRIQDEVDRARAIRMADTLHRANNAGMLDPVEYDEYLKTGKIPE